LDVYLLSLLQSLVAKGLELKVCLTMQDRIQLSFCLGDERSFS